MHHARFAACASAPPTSFPTSSSSSSSSSCSSSSSSHTLPSPTPQQPPSEAPSHSDTSHPMSSLLSDDNILRLRADSLTTLRFAKSLQQATEHLTQTRAIPVHQLSRLLLSSVPLAPSPTLYLSQYTPAQNLFHSLLAALANNSISLPLHNLLMHVAVHPHAAQALTTTSLSPKDAVALHFVRAVVAWPPRIPIELRNAFKSMHTSDKTHHISLIACFAAFYSTIASLLGLGDNPMPPSLRDPDAEMRAMLVRADAHFAVTPVEPSEMSLPTSTSYSRASSAFSFSNRLSQTSKSLFFDRVAQPLKVKIARHALHHSERTSWLSTIPTSRRSQNQFICAAMGFVPEYLTALRSQSLRAVFIYLLDTILLKDSSSHALSTATKNLACYILARSSENSVLTAHTAFLANRFGALDDQLMLCTHIPKLRAMQRAYNIQHPPTSTSHSSSSMTLTEDYHHASLQSQPDAQPNPQPEPERRSRRYDRFRFPEFASGVAFDATPRRPRANTPSSNHHHDDATDSDQEPLTGEDSFLQSEPSLLRRGFARLTRKDSDRRATLKRTMRRHQPARLDDYDSRIRAWESDSCDSSTKSSSTTTNTARVDSVHSLLALSDDPQVPEVSGLNSITTDDYDGFEDDDIEIERSQEYSALNEYVSAASFDDQHEDDDSELDLSLFSREEVAFLLLAHDVAQTSRNNSRVCAKFANATPTPLISPDQATIMHRIFEPEAIMEQVAVLSAFSFLQRWIECYPYRPGALEAPVRRFAQTPIAHTINLGAVGQRSDSKYSEDLRVQTGRPLRLPRHAVARCDI